MCRLVPVALVAVVLTGRASALPPPSTVESHRLIRELGSEDYYKREAASKSLRSLGKRALPALRVASASTDAEVRKRARLLVDKLTPVPQVVWNPDVPVRLKMNLNADVIIFQPQVFVAPMQVDDVRILMPRKPAKR